MLIVVSIGMKNKRIKKMMSEEELLDLLDQVDDIFHTNINGGFDPIEVASVVFAVAVKHLKMNLDKNDFTAILDEIRNTDIDDLITVEVVKKERTIH